MNNIEDKIKHIQENLNELNIIIDPTKVVLNRTEHKSILAEPQLLVTSSSKKNFIPKFALSNIIYFVKDMYKVMLVVPVVIFLFLYIKKPTIVMKKDKKTNKLVLDKTKFKVILVVSILVCYVLLYFFRQKFQKQT